MNSNKRFFEVFNKVNNVNLKLNNNNSNIYETIVNNSNLLLETVLPLNKKKELIIEFISFVSKKLNFENKLPKVILINKDNEAKLNKSFANFNPNDNSIRVVINNRNLADILRSLGHELVHYTQNLKGILTSTSGENGSEHENEANSTAGLLMREFGQLNPIIFE